MRLASVARTRAAALRVKMKPTEEILGRTRRSAMRALGVRAKADRRIVGCTAGPGEEDVVLPGEARVPGGAPVVLAPMDLLLASSSIFSFRSWNFFLASS